MFPIHDNIPSRTFPWVTYSIIVLCSIAFAIQFSAGDERNQSIVEQWGLVPGRLTAEPSQKEELKVEVVAQLETSSGYRRAIVTRDLLPAATSDWMTLITCMFLHGSLMHFAGNMWFLHIFGDNVEDRFGHLLYATLYTCAGLIAGVAHLLSNPGSLIPTIGASGAIAGVMGAYIILYPKSVVETLIPLPFLFTTFAIPAPIFLGIWFVLQIVQGAMTDVAGGGVAWWAHVGGFVAGAAAAGILVVTHIASPPVEEQREGLERWGFYKS